VAANITIMDKSEGDLGDQVFAAEAIMRQRYNKKEARTEYLVKWKGWSASANTWEPVEHILDQRLIHQYNKRVALGQLPGPESPTGSAGKRGRKSKAWHEANKGEGTSTAKPKKKEPPKTPAYISQTLSGRTPKPPERYQENAASKGKQRNRSGKKEESSEDEEGEGEGESQLGQKTGVKRKTPSTSSTLAQPTSSSSGLASPSSVSSTSSVKKAKVGITIKKSPNSENRNIFETTLLGADDDDDEEEYDDDDDGGQNEDAVSKASSSSSSSDEEDEYENFKSALLDHTVESDEAKEAKAATATGGAIVRPRLKPVLAAEAATVTEKQKPTKRRSPSPDIALFEASELPESDSEYEFEEIIELREWFPPDHWRHVENGKNSSAARTGPVKLTDVTVRDLTVTLRESQCREGFFKAMT